MTNILGKKLPLLFSLSPSTPLPIITTFLAVDVSLS